MKPKLIGSVVLGKILSKATKLLGSGGTALPGLVSNILNPNLLSDLTNQLSEGSVLISGTNGKTTTARIMGAILASSKHSFIHNRAGSNLLRGMSASMMEHSSWWGSLKAQYGIFEVDEFVLPLALEQIKTKVIVLNNLFRDQLDRYGEIDSIRTRWSKSLTQLDKNTVLVLNGDDPSIAHLGHDTKARVLYFGLDDTNHTLKKVPHSADSIKCQQCGEFLYFDHFYLSHMGAYACKKCGFSRPALNVKASNIVLNGTNGSHFDLTLGENTISVALALPGLYNVYNALAAATGAAALGLTLETIEAGLRAMKPAFGRGETLTVNEKELYMSLVKNPAGFDEVLRLLTTDAKKKSFFIIINDLIADGTDVSWLWDVNFELLHNHCEKIIIGGSRCYDLALRLKYANLDLEKEDITIEPNLEKAYETALTKLKQGETLYILPTYTAMLALRALLTKKSGLTKFWED